MNSKIFGKDIYSNTFKVIVIGAPNVGKSELMEIFQKSRNISDYKLDIGVDFYRKEDIEFKKGELATLQIWDLIRHHRSNFLHKEYCKGAHGAIFFFDLKQEQTYKEVKEWYVEFKEITGSIPFILIGYNVHLLKPTDPTLIRDKARNFAIDEGGIYIETSPMRIPIFEEAIRELIRRMTVIFAKERK